MNFFDTHCHINFENSDWHSIAVRAVSSGVTLMNNIGEEPNVWDEVIETGKNMPSNIITTIGVHPTSVHNFDQDEILMRIRSRSENIKAIGEAGLDYHYLENDSASVGLKPDELIKAQKTWFKSFILEAKAQDKTLVMHCRDAYEDFYEILKSDWEKGMRGVVHFYIGTPAMAKKLLDLGLYIGFTGVITFPKTEAYAENVMSVPTEYIVTETDSPFVAPQKYRGKTNEPAYVSEVVKKIAEIKKIPLEEAAFATVKAGRSLFDI